MATPQFSGINGIHFYLRDVLMLAGIQENQIVYVSIGVVSFQVFITGIGVRTKSSYYKSFPTVWTYLSRKETKKFCYFFIRCSMANLSSKTTKIFTFILFVEFSNRFSELVHHGVPVNTVVVLMLICRP